MEYRLKRCPCCGEQVSSMAPKCKHCGVWTNERDLNYSGAKKRISVKSDDRKKSSAQPFLGLSIAMFIFSAYQIFTGSSMTRTFLENILLSGKSYNSTESIRKSSRFSTVDPDLKPQELALMAMLRCLYTGGHINRNEATKLIAQINKEQSGQFQRVYDMIYKGASEEINSKVNNMIRSEKGCRLLLTRFAESAPSTDLKKRIQEDWVLKPIKYYDED